jgi:DNA-binding NtrC family response regulator
VSSPRPQSGVRPVRVLLVDDDWRVREVLRAQLELEGFGVLEAADGIVARRLLDTEYPIDVVVTDIFMPREDGMRVIHEAGLCRPKVPGVVITGGGPHHNLSALTVASALGAGAVLQKPFDGRALVAAIRRVLKATQ